jgi:dTDP-glucose 4,6-dehydratase
MKLLVTGGYGFIGSNFINLASESDYKIINIDNATYAADKNNIRVKNITNIETDIAEYSSTEKIILDFQPDIIVHFAAESHVDNSIENPYIFLNTNILGTYNLLQACSKLENNFHFIHISTDEVFGELGKKGFFNEKTNYDPKSPYSASKASSDHLVRAWENTYGFPATIVNCCNNYGPNQHKEKLIPKIITNCFSNNSIPIYGKGDNIRDWIFVEDFCKAILLILENRESVLNESFCIGANQEFSNVELTEKICSIINDNFSLKHNCLDLITYVDDRLGHDFRYAIDASKIKKDLGWKPEYSFEEAIMKTIDYYKGNL